MTDRRTDLENVASITLSTSGHCARIIVSGDVDEPDAERLVDVAAIALRNTMALDIDLAAVGVFGSAATRALEEISALGERLGSQVQLLDQPAHVQHALKVLENLPRSISGERVRRERLLVASSEFDRVIAQGVLRGRESIVVTTPDMRAPGPTIVFVNRAFTDLTGYSADEMIGRSPRVLQGPLTDRLVLDQLSKNVAAGEPFNGEVVNYRKDGSPFVNNWRVVAVGGDRDHSSYLMAMQCDVTEHRRLARFETALTYLETRCASCMASESQQEHVVLDALLAAEVSLMGGGDAIGQLTRQDGGVITAATAPGLLEEHAGLIPGSSGGARSSFGESSTVLRVPIKSGRHTSVLGGSVTLLGMHPDRLALADADLHAQLASHACESLRHESSRRHFTLST